MLAHLKKMIIILLKQQQEKENDVLTGKWQQNDVNLDQFVQQMQFNYSLERTRSTKYLLSGGLLSVISGTDLL